MAECFPCRLSDSMGTPLTFSSHLGPCHLATLASSPFRIRNRGYSILFLCFLAAPKTIKPLGWKLATNLLEVGLIFFVADGASRGTLLILFFFLINSLPVRGEHEYLLGFLAYFFGALFIFINQTNWNL